LAEPSPEVWVQAAAPLPGGAARITFGDVAVAVFDLDGELVAFDDRCLHKGGSLSLGYVHDGSVTCAEHWWRYDLRTGERVGSPALCLRRYPVERHGDAIRVAIPKRPSGLSMRERLLLHARAWTGDR
jgi:nitrite reductase/ring-hydroxylating ferredoxin subunit